MGHTLACCRLLIRQALHAGAVHGHNAWLHNGLGGSVVLPHLAILG